MPSDQRSSSQSSPIFLLDDSLKYLDCNFIKLSVIKHRIHQKGLRISRKSIKLLKIFCNKQIEGYLEKIKNILIQSERIIIKPVHFRQLFRQENIKIRILSKDQTQLEKFFSK